MTDHRTVLNFRANSAKAVSDRALRSAMKNATDTTNAKRVESFSAVSDADGLRDRAGAIRLEMLNNIERYVDRFTRNAEAAGATVHHARDARSAQDIVVGLLKRRNVRRVVKAKSMISEEIHLNARLESEGIVPVETDLGEYIVQLAGEAPSHVTAPAIHKTRQQVGELFAEKLGVQYTDDPYQLTKVARRILRQEFLEAQAGITGANFAVSETGSIVLFTNEGNGRMVTGIPPLHIAVLSIEKVVPQLTDVAVFTSLLPRSATGQAMTSYLTVITGTRKPDESIGAEELHIILLDNGRRRILEGECREILKCIRCGACLNVCPVYRTVGGHTYGSTYSGPMGIILTSLLEGMDRAGSLLDATTLCGACSDVCPVRVPLKELLTVLKRTRAQNGLSGPVERAAMAAFGTVASSPSLFGLGTMLLRLFWGVLTRFGPDAVLDRLPLPAKSPFRRRVSAILAQRTGPEQQARLGTPARISESSESPVVNQKSKIASAKISDRFITTDRETPERRLNGPALSEVKGSLGRPAIQSDTISGNCYNCRGKEDRPEESRHVMTQDDLVTLFLETSSKVVTKAIRVTGLAQIEELVRDLLTEEGSVFCPGLTEKEKAVIIPEERRAQGYRSAAVTIEEVSGAIAETGSIICSASGGRALQSGMLPEHHVAIVSREKIFRSIDSFLESVTTLPSTLTFITGPSRTADIEKKLVIGVHGPERLTVAVW